MGLTADAAQPQAQTAPQTEADLAAVVADSFARRQPLGITGGGTRLRPPTTMGMALTTRGLDGIVTYEPGALTLIARAGTPLDQIEQMLAAEGQSLAFEPMDHRVALGTNGTPTIGGMVAANVSGPRRLRAGACRDHLLGVRFVDGQGRILKNGGRVMKNVTGMDLGKLLCGAHGTLGVLTEVAIKTLPLAEAQKTMAFGGLSPRAAVGLFGAALATPFEVSGAAFHGGTAWLRIEGLARQVDYRCERLAALLRGHGYEHGHGHDIIAHDESVTLWRALRDLRHFADRPGAVWRILAKPTDAPAVCEALAVLGGATSLDWGGGLVWYCADADATAVRATLGAAVPGALATLVRPGTRAHGPVFPIEAPGVAALATALRRTFDPAGILNPGLMGARIDGECDADQL